MTFVIDTHAHLYSCYDIGRFLECSWRNLEQFSPSSTKAIILTERMSERYFERAVSTGHLGLYPIERTQELISVRVQLAPHKELWVISGKQYNSIEGLEILALGAVENIQDKQPATDLILEISRSGSIAVIPWSFGKWTLSRKKLVTDLINNTSLHFCLGDIFGRPKVIGSEKIFEGAKIYGRQILSGTDTLPMSGEETHACSLCTEFSSPFDPSFPFQSLKNAMGQTSREVGDRQDLLSALARQVKLRCK